MTLLDWLRSTQTAPMDLAQQIYVTPEAVRRYATGDRIPRREIMIRIVKATGGKVQPGDFYLSAAE